MDIWCIFLVKLDFNLCMYKLNELDEQNLWKETIKVLAKSWPLYHPFSPKDVSSSLYRRRSQKNVTFPWVGGFHPSRDILFVWFKIVFCAFVVYPFTTFFVTHFKLNCVFPYNCQVSFYVFVFVTPPPPNKKKKLTKNIKTLDVWLHHCK